MFERYTEKARRVIFFSRYEASEFSSPYIEAEHILLGLLRECHSVEEWLTRGTADLVRATISKDEKERIPTTVDLPLSHEAKRVLSFAAEEAERLSHKHIDCGHIFAGFLRLDPSPVHRRIEAENGDLGLLLQCVRDSLGTVQA